MSATREAANIERPLGLRQNGQDCHRKTRLERIFSVVFYLTSTYVAAATAI